MLPTALVRLESSRPGFSGARRRPALLPILLLLLAALGAQGVLALSFDHDPSPEEIFELSTFAFRGTVLGVESMPLDSSEPDGVIYSRVTVQVDLGYRGTSAGRVEEIFHVGGQLSSGEGFVIPGVPLVQAGDRVALFMNDGYHPFFLGLYADRGLMRLYDEGSQTIVTTAHHSPLLSDLTEPLRAVQCVPDERQPSRCAAWVDPDGERVPDGPGEGLVTVEAFDAWVFDKLGTAGTAGTSGTGGTGGSAAPARLLPDETSFRNALADWWRQINIPAAD